ncbi:hypothetical protein [Flavobacterium sp. I3-2]|uniref:hypothetical protein n=1 Tax=Flavobacterium sp. I3-2 TaxID=2748319 RepID=UPI0015B12770|nr:hypothetical protein [Flavobacterium sp. I3-2]
MNKLLLIAILSILSISSYGQQSNPDELIKKFFTEYPKNSGKALDELYETNPWNVRIKDGIETIKKEVNSYNVDYVGKYYGYELITKKKLSESFVLYSYMVKYDRQPMRFVFKFYKPNDKWILFGFEVDTNLDDELSEAAKIYFLKLDDK